MMRQLEKLRVDDNFFGGGFGRNQRIHHSYVYEEYKTYGKFQHDEEQGNYRCGHGRHELMMAQGHHRPRFSNGPAFKGIEEKDTENEYFGKRLHQVMPYQSSPVSPLKYKAQVVAEDEEEEEKEEYEVEEEEDYRARLMQYKMEHQGNADVHKQPPLQYKAPAMNRESSKDEARYRYQSTQQFNHERPSDFKISPPITPPKNNKLNTDGWGRCQEESHKEMQYVDKFVAPEIFTRMVFVRPSPGQGGAMVKPPEKKWKEPAAAMGNWGPQHGGYKEPKWVPKGLYE